MGEKIIVGPIDKGLRTDRLPFNIDNDSFPMLINAYQWRGRAKRKRGTSFLARLQRTFNSGTSFITLDGSGNGNLITGFSLQTNSAIVPGSVVLTDIDSPGLSYTDPGKNGILVGNPSGSGTINYASGAIVITVSLGHRITAIFNYNPALPVMGLEDLTLTSTQFPNTLAFDTTYSYNVPTTAPYTPYDVSFYKNPAADPVNLPGYAPKATQTALTWNGQNYQQFWTVNYEGALWATNGISVPFTTTNVGMQFVTITNVAINAAGPPAIVTITTSLNHGLVVGDFVFINEIIGMTGINFQTGYVIATPAANQIQVEFPNAMIAGAYASGGIVQYLTNRINPALDTLRWFDGDPTINVGVNGWVNFAPPISQSNFSISNLPAAQYYLVTARMIVPFKDRLLFIGPVVQTSAAGSQVYLQDTIIYSQNSTPYYTASFTGNVDLPTTIFHPILVPQNQTATANAYFSDSTGFGGFIVAGISQPIITVGANEDALILGFSYTQMQLVYTQNDILPFNFFIINSEKGSSSTFSSIVMDNGVMTRGNRGIIITNQRGCERIDIPILDQIFEMQLSNNGAERICSQRDFDNEWIYLTYLSNEQTYIFPNQTLLYNYRDNSWAIFNECFTTYGTFRKVSGYTWLTIPWPWNQWNEPWNAGSTANLEPDVIGGNQQGFILIREDSTSEGTSLYIQNIVGTTVTSPNHCLNDGDYIYITNALGMTNVNNLIFQVSSPSTNTFTILPTGTNALPSGTYIGSGLITRLYIPQIQTKQFPTAWGMGRKTRLGVQQYLLTKTDKAQVTLLIFLSQDVAEAYNQGNIVPAPNTENNSLIYSAILYTCPESINLGLTPANTNLLQLNRLDGSSNLANSQGQIWHRVNTSLIGDTVQLEITLSDEQMTTVNDDGSFISQFAEIELHGIILDVTPSQLLS